MGLNSLFKICGGFWVYEWLCEEAGHFLLRRWTVDGALGVLVSAISSLHLMLDHDAADVEDVDFVDIPEIGFQFELVEMEGDSEAGVSGSKMGCAY